MLAASAGAIIHCSAKVRKEMDDRKVPLMGVLGAFLFAAQMINFTIPATGSSGHLGGGLLLAILLGSHAAFLTIASVLMVQALFFADGGLLALGCNIFNLGIFPAFVAYPLIYRPLAGREPSNARIFAAAIAAGIAGLQMGALAVVLETTLSGISALPFRAFVSLMQPIHLGIGIVEGVITATIIGYIHKARPDIFTEKNQNGSSIMKSIFPAFLALALITGGAFSWLASEHPDGLEWSIEKVTGREEIEEAKSGLHGRLSALQEKLAFLPDYNFRGADGAKEADIRLGTSISGIIGAIITLVLTVLAGLFLRRRQKLAARKPHAHEHAHPHVHEHEHLHNHGATTHSHGHTHEHSHPHPHLHDHSQPHAEDPNPAHTHEAAVAQHTHEHAEPEHGGHDHQH
jgi:cobalt/nickel transport system permease protein